jgi:1-acyl-sn-glycerol-3-phosphate acyltransferase
MIYRLTWLLCRFIFRVFFRWRVTGAENVPATGPVILASNHISALDPPVVAVGVTRPTTFMAKEELFRYPVFGWFIRQLNAFPVRRGAADRAALKRSLELVEAGWAFAMFPEGTRSRTGELQEPEMGVGLIAYRTGAPVVPVYVWGTDRAMPGRGVRLAQFGVCYGPPMRFALPEGEKPGREQYEEAARAIMRAIAELRDARAGGALSRAGE